MYLSKSSYYLLAVLLISAFGFDNICCATRRGKGTIDVCGRINWLENTLWTCTDQSQCLFTQQLYDMRWQVADCAPDSVGPTICCPYFLPSDEFITEEQQQAACKQPRGHMKQTCEKITDCSFTKEIFLRKTRVFCGYDDDVPKICCSDPKPKTSDERINSITQFKLNDRHPLKIAQKVFEDASARRAEAAQLAANTSARTNEFALIARNYVQCQLPPKSETLTYLINGCTQTSTAPHCQRQPGELVNRGVALQVQCYDIWRKFITFYTTCADGRWLPAIESCSALSSTNNQKIIRPNNELLHWISTNLPNTPSNSEYRKEDDDVYSSWYAQHSPFLSYWQVPQTLDYGSWYWHY